MGDGEREVGTGEHRGPLRGRHVTIGRADVEEVCETAARACESRVKLASCLIGGEGSLTWLLLFIVLERQLVHVELQPRLDQRALPT